MSGKTHAELIKEINCGPIPEHRHDREILRLYAHELEAAYKRERGDVAKLREALSKSCAYFAVVLNTGMFNRVHLEALLNMAKAALAARPRNCDVYNNESCRMAYHLHGDGLMTMQAFADWLFAPATEQEGENDGNE